MRIPKIVLVAMMVVSSVAWSVPSYAKGPSTTGHQNSQRPSFAGPQASNKGGALRGLDRANLVAGSHGQAGRTNAATHHP
jgi:hypothetical protein